MRAAGDERKETATVSYNDCKSRHSGDGVILLVDDDAHLSAIFISDIRGDKQEKADVTLCSGPSCSKAG